VTYMFRPKLMRVQLA